MIVLLIRSGAMLCSGIVCALSGRIFLHYLFSPETTLFRTRAMFLSAGIVAYAVFGAWRILDKVVHHEPWEFHSSPGLLLASGLVSVGLFKFLERRRKAPKVIG